MKKMGYYGGKRFSEMVQTLRQVYRSEKNEMTEKLKSSLCK